MAEIPPVSAARSVSSRIRRLYFAVKLRRFGASVNSVVATTGAATTRETDVVGAGTSGEGGKAEGRRSGITIRSFSSALKCKLQTKECLTRVGTEGAALSGTIAWNDRHGTAYALKGNITVSAQAAGFMAGLLGIIVQASSDMAQAVPDSAGVVFVPALAGLGAFDQGHGLGEGFTARVVARKKPVLSASSDQPQGPFGWIIVDGHATIRQEQAERWPAVQSIAKRLGEVAFAQNVAQLLVRPNAEGLCPWA